MNDTTTEFLDKYQRLIMARSPSDRVVMACRMFSTVKSLMIAGIRNGNGDIQENVIRQRLFQRLYGNDLPPENLRCIEKFLAENK
jgi:hypothetical protein